MTTSKVIDFYSNCADSYDNDIFQDKDYTAFEKLPPWIINALGDGHHLIADLGCGTGLAARPFFEKKWDVAGIDITPKMIEKCRLLPYTSLYCQSLESPLPFQDSSFDAAIMVGVMEFIQNPEGFLKEVFRILKPNHYFALTIPVKLPAEKEEKLEILTFEPNAIEALFKKTGFILLHQEIFQGFIYLDETIQYKGYLLKSC